MNLAYRGTMRKHTDWNGREFLQETSEGEMSSDFGRPH